jgi:uncharacterized protein (DUF305 family)
MSAKTLGVIGAACVIAIVAAVALIGGGDEEAEANETDGAFLTEMKAHHEMAIEMAETAEERAQHPEIEELAGEIVTAQSNEIETLEGIHERLFGEPIGEMPHGSLGLPADQMGMDMDMEELEKAKPFDSTFIDMMVPHHQGAIRMARIELDQGGNDETKSLASAIITAQSGEITTMNDWREQWYGAPSPAGGVPSDDLPPEDEAMEEEMSGMEH